MDFPGLHPGNGSVPGTAGASASWQDIMFLGSNDPNVVGTKVRLTFEASGSFLQGNGPGFAQKDVYVNTGAVAPPKTSVELFSDGGSKGGFDWLLGDASSYIGEFHVDVPLFNAGYISSIPGSIYFQYVTTAGTTSFVGGNPFFESTETSASDPLQFISITLPDKGNVTPESLGVSVTFDSGLLSPNIATPGVPEPATLTLLGIGIAGLAGYGWRRRKLVV
jgi:hypothetical protein